MNMKFGKIKEGATTGTDKKLMPFTIVPGLGTDDRENRIYLGGTEWGNNEWKGSLYPEQSRSRDFLKYYQQQLNTIELNTTFYRIPNQSTVERWKDMTNPSFKFCPKVPLLISRTKDPDSMSYFIDEFTAVIRSFGENLGPCFIQWPESSGINDFEIFEHFAGSWPEDLAVSMEFRHTSCFENRTLHVDLLSLLSDFSMDCVITDVMGRRDVVHSTVIHSNVLVRFVSSGDMEIDYARLDDWKRAVDDLQATHQFHIYLFIHEGPNYRVPDLTLYADRLFYRPGKIRLWKDSNSSGQNQTSLF